MTVQFKVLQPGTATAPLPKLDAPISFWGGIDQFTSRIFDTSHPQRDADSAGNVLFVPLICSSGGTPGNLATMAKFCRAPAAIVLGKGCINTVTGAVIAQELYGVNCPVFQGEAAYFAALRNGVTIRIGETRRFETTG